MRRLDLAVILAYLAGITWFGARFRGSQHSLRDYFLGGRAIPWWAIALSIVSAETSTLTVIGTPVLAFQGDFGFLQLVLGYLLARIVIVTLFLPAYFRGEMYTAYELIRRRFGERLRRLSALAFLILRALAEGVRVFAISIVVSVILGADEIPSIVGILCLTLFYTYEGGLAAVIWTDVVQMFLYVFRRGSQPISPAPRDSWWMGARRGSGRAAREITRVRFPAGPSGNFLFPNVHVLGRDYWRMLSDHGEPRHGTAIGAAAAGRA